MNFKVGDKVKILWEKSIYTSEYEHMGEVHSMSKKYIKVTVRRKSPPKGHLFTLAFRPEELVRITRETRNGDTL